MDTAPYTGSSRTRPCTSVSGLTYVRCALRTPQCRHPTTQWPAARCPITSPRMTTSPTFTDGSTGSSSARQPARRMLTKGRPASRPAKITTPDTGAKTADPTGARRSMPRCPGPYLDAGALNGRATDGRATGHPHWTVAAALAASGAAASSTPITTAAATTGTRSRRNPGSVTSRRM